jgi:hypothetical protein
MIEPPYSENFINIFLKILLKKRTIDSLDKNMNILSKFLSFIINNHFNLLNDNYLKILSNLNLIEL